MKTFKSLNVLLLAGLLSSVSAVQAVEEQKIIGAGPSTKVVGLFAKGLAKEPAVQGYSFEVPPRSAKHAGGIKASRDFVFGRTGRPLNAKERGMKKEEIFLARIPIAFVVGSGVGVKQLNIGQIEKIFTGAITNWKTVGGPDAPIFLAGRESGEALFSVLKANKPEFAQAKFKKVFKKDHQVVNFIKSPAGKFAIGFGAKPNFQDLNLVQIEGFSVGVSVGLVYDQKNQGHALVSAAKRYAASSNWRGQLGSLDLLPPE